MQTTFATSSTINILMLLFLFYLIANNTIMLPQKRKAYMLVIIITVIVIVAEVSTVTFDLLGATFRIPNIIANIVGFSLSICIPVLLAIVFDEKLSRKLNLICIPILVNFLLLLISAWTGWIFYITQDNLYVRGPFFGVYILTYIFTFILLLISNYHQSTQYQNEERTFLMLLYAILFIGTTVQIILPSMHTSWHCITLVLVMYYLFQRELQFKYDTLTNLLNREAFEKKLDHLNGTDQTGIVLFDLDKFKEINDTHGHTKGDYYLKTAASIIKNSFSKIGHCYRIGGDEFCVLTHSINEKEIHACIKNMLQSIQQARAIDAFVPNISYGYSIYIKNEKENILLSFQEADKRMYSFKKTVEAQ